jgi:hypothetical protein
LLMGTFRHHDAEREEPDMLIACMSHNLEGKQPSLREASLDSFESLAWRRPNQLRGLTLNGVSRRSPGGCANHVVIVTTSALRIRPCPGRRKRVRFRCVE